jgi:SSS family transporter
MTALHTVDWLICFGYFAVVTGVGLWFAREQHDNEDYFVGGRRMHWLPIGLSLFAGTFSSTSFVGLPRAAAYHDWHLLLAILFIPVAVMPLVGWLFVPLFFRLRLTSAYEYLERRFDYSVRLIASVLFTLYTIGWMGTLLKAVGAILYPVLQLQNDTQLAWVLIGVGTFATLYTTLGGVKAVVWTDALQAITLGGGMLTILLMAVGRIDGGWASIVEIGTRENKFDMFHLDANLQTANFFSACAFGFFVYLAGHAVHFTAVQRYVSMPTIAAARWSLAVNGLMVGAVCAIFFLVGTSLFVFYAQQRERHAASETTAATTSNLFDELKFSDAKKQAGEKNIEDQLMPRFLMSELALPGLMGLLLAGLFAAAMSSIDSGINSLTATVVCDWLRGKNLPLRYSRMLTIAFGALAIATALVLQRIGGPVFEWIMAIAGTFLGLMLGIFLLGMLSPRSNTPGVYVGLAGGVVVYAVCRMAGMSFWWDGACTSLSTLFIGLVASLAFAPPDHSRLKGLEVGRM